MIKTILIFIAVATIVCSNCYTVSKKQWNNGKCKCGGDWKYFDTDSQGGDGYECTNCGKVIWQSWYKPKEIDQ